MSTDYEELIKLEMMGKHPSSTGWTRINCPFCSYTTGKADTKSSMAVSATTGRFVCWKCDEKGNIDIGYGGDFVIHQPLTPLEVYEPPPGYLPLGERPGSVMSELRPAREYLIQRLGPRAKRLAKKYDIGACISGRERGRIIIPVKDHTGRHWVGWVGRDYTGKAKRKYFNAKNMTRVLFNSVELHRPHNFILVVEGIFDALPYLPAVVACLGKPSKDQVDQLRACASPVVIALDGDAWREGWGLSRRLRMAGKRCGFVKLPPGQDPGSVDPSWLVGEAAASLVSDQDDKEEE